MAATMKVRVIIVSCVVCNVDFMSSAKGWTIAIVTVCGILIVVVHIIFKVSIPVIVSQRVKDVLVEYCHPEDPEKRQTKLKFQAKH